MVFAGYWRLLLQQAEHQTRYAVGRDASIRVVGPASTRRVLRGRRVAIKIRVTPTAGRVDCTSLSPARRPTTTAFQDYALFALMSVGNNVGFGLRVRGVAKSGHGRRARAALATGLSDVFDRRPRQLCRESAPLGQGRRASLFVDLPRDEMALLIELVVHLGMN
jgi:ABC-type taurine transport system ATPase subunit